MLARMRERFARAIARPVAANDASPARGADFATAAAILQALHVREGRGERTTIRQIHNLIGVDQRRALNILRQLESGSLIKIESSLHDEFNSSISLADAVRTKIEQIFDNT